MRTAHALKRAGRQRVPIKHSNLITPLETRWPGRKLQICRGELETQHRRTRSHVAFWCASHGGQRETAEYLLFKRGADLNWVSLRDGLTPLDAPCRGKAVALVVWLVSQGAKSAKATS